MKTKEIIEALTALDKAEKVYVEVETETKICIVEIKDICIQYSPNVRKDSFIIITLGEDIKADVN